ncbi:ATP-binding cassette domain-containing protein [Paracraurococcus lichenis]|uniref:ATP-binding cassette domain-containing protein n=1 Tax=Paracraurococcus lichenis TaxID=3064888 RepID=A0ABT9E9X9_9PROT|nr:ATP-binding cassette domain-containing protein [Paracraurococcus sp. LOR1-02]MDO9712725.1 ATP-binding cassette domain-containing protein [Paracraurococcus sp. LOR1-02]
MKALLARLKRTRTGTAWLFAAAFLVNLLGLASSTYSIHVLNRYVAQGISGTLVALTSGVLLALLGELALRHARFRLAEDIVGDADRSLQTGLFGLLLTVRYDALSGLPPARRLEMMAGVIQAEAALGPGAIATLSDVPFSLLYLGVLFLLSPAIAAAAALCAIAMCLYVLQAGKALTRPVQESGSLSERLTGLTAAANAGAETLRMFGGGAALMARWSETLARRAGVAAGLARRQNADGALIYAIQALTGIAVIGIGAILVVTGGLTTGLVIGANLVAGRALAPLARAMQLVAGLRRAEAALANAARLSALPVEGGTGTLPSVAGRITVQDVEWHDRDYPVALLSDLSFELPAGGVLAITGANGAGKSTLLQILLGLRQPHKGQVLVDGAALSQLSPAWWRSQVSYMPQEPWFFEGTLRDNMLAARPGAGASALRGALEGAGIARFVDTHPKGLELPLLSGGTNLSPGVRRQMALARALLVDGQIVVLDEPTEGLDRTAAEALYRCLIDLGRCGRTMIIVSHDPNVVRAAPWCLDLSAATPAMVRKLELGVAA